MSSSVCNDSVPSPTSSPGTPLPSKRIRKSLNLSSVTPKSNIDNTCKLKGKIPNVKVGGRFMRSMAKGNRVKPPVSDGVHVEIVVINDEEGNPVLPNDGRDIEHEFIPNPADNNSHVFDNDIQLDPVVDPVFHSLIKGNPAEPNFSGSYPVGGMVHPLFVNCLLDKIRRMEGEVRDGCES